MWQSWKEQLSPRDIGLGIVFSLGVLAVLVGIFTGNLGMIAAGTTLFGVASIGKA